MKFPSSGVSGTEAKTTNVGLPPAQVQLTSACGAHLAARIEQAKQAGRLQTALRRQPRRMLQRRARDRMEKVDRHRIRSKAARRIGQIDYVVVGLAHPDHSPPAYQKPRRAHVFDRPHAVVPRMRRADFRIKAPARVEIVVNPTGSRSLQPSRLFLAHQSERETKLERRILPAAARAGFGPMIAFARAGSAHAAHHAVAPCSARNRHPRPLAQLFDALHFVYGNVGARNPRLRAVAAIFRTYTALRVSQDP